MSHSPQLSALVEGKADACAWGTLEWRAVNGQWRATVDVAATDFAMGELTLEMVYRPGRRASEPSVLLMHNGKTVRRVDVNGAHRENGASVQRASHIQGEPPPDFFQWLHDHPILAGIVQDSTPDGSVLQRVFESAAREMNVDVSGTDWTDPPEGRP